MTGALQANKLGDVLEILTEYILLALGDNRNVAQAELEQFLASLRIIQYVDGNEIDFFARKKLFRPETAASPGLGKEDELFVGAHI